MLVSLLPLFATRVKRWRRPGHGGALFAGFAAVWVATIMISPLARDGQRLYQQLRPVDFARIAPEYQVPTQPLQRPRRTSQDTTGTFSAGVIWWPHPGHRDRGWTTDSPAGTR